MSDSKTVFITVACRVPVKASAHAVRRAIANAWYGPVHLDDREARAIGKDEIKPRVMIRDTPPHAAAPRRKMT